MVFDLVFLVILVWAAYRGFSKGVILQAATLLALVLGIFGAIKFLKSNGSTVILITHSLEVLKRAEHAFLLCHGTIIAEGSINKISKYFGGKCIPCDRCQHIETSVKGNDIGKSAEPYKTHGETNRHSKYEQDKKQGKDTDDADEGKTHFAPSF